jgi:hypothetical protein
MSEVGCSNNSFLYPLKGPLLVSIIRCLGTLVQRYRRHAEYVPPRLHTHHNISIDLLYTVVAKVFR